MLSYLLREIKLSGVVNSQSEDGETLLHAAARKGSERMIFELAGDEPGFGGNVNSVDVNGNTPLHVAAESKQPSAARFLLSLGTELETRNNAGNTALHLAVQAENLRTAKDLLLKGAERKARNERDQVPGDFVDQIQDRQLKKSFKSALVSALDRFSSYSLANQLFNFQQYLELALVLWVSPWEASSDASISEQSLSSALRDTLFLHRDNADCGDSAR